MLFITQNCVQTTSLPSLTFLRVVNFWSRLSVTCLVSKIINKKDHVSPTKQTIHDDMWNSGIFFQFSFWMFLWDFFLHFKVWYIILVALLVYRYFQRLANICWGYNFICKETDVWCYHKLNKQISCKHLNKKCY